jgi:hypothetical protein
VALIVSATADATQHRPPSRPPLAPGVWSLVFSDGFTTPAPRGTFPDSSAYASRYLAYGGGDRDSSGRGSYDPGRVLSVHGGMLDYWLHSENGTPLVAALVPVWKCTTGFSCGGQAYGRYVVRFRADPLAGYKTSWLLWPDSNAWPDDGEIDFPESGSSLNGTIYGALHFAGDGFDDLDWFDTGVTYKRWHTAEVQWTPGRVLFLLDGKVVHVTARGVPSNPMHWVLQTETSTNGSVPSPKASGHVYIDSIKAYAYTP